MSAVYISATSHLIKHQIWTWPFVWLRFYVLSGHTDAEQRPAHFASRLQSHHRPICLCGGNFRVKVRTRSSFFFFFRENRTGSLAFEKLESYISHRSGGHIYTYLERREHVNKTQSYGIYRDWWLEEQKRNQRKHCLFYKISMLL